jgi:hypothetical protein
LLQAKDVANVTPSRYENKLKVGAVCMNRCTKLLQPFDREKDGRVFTCKDCNFQTCTNCDKPEHSNETCREYLDRLRTVHAAAEDATHASFRNCPSCDALFDTEGCGFTQCRGGPGDNMTGCGYRFCSRCMIPWVGEDSAYTGGKEAHGEDCLYRNRDRPSDHALKRRFKEPDDVQARIDQKDLENEIKREAKKAKKTSGRKQK